MSKELNLQPRAQVVAQNVAPKVADLEAIRAKIEADAIQSAALAAMMPKPEGVPEALDGQFPDFTEVFGGQKTVVPDSQALVDAALQNIQQQPNVTIMPSAPNIIGPPKTVREMVQQNRQPKPDAPFPELHDIFRGSVPSQPVLNGPIQMAPKPLPAPVPQTKVVVEHRVPERQNTGFVCINTCDLMNDRGEMVHFEKDQYITEPHWIDLINYNESQSFVAYGDLDQCIECPKCQYRFQPEGR